MTKIASHINPRSQFASLLKIHGVDDAHDCLILSPNRDVIWGSGTDFDDARADARSALSHAYQDCAEMYPDLTESQWLDKAISECVAIQLA